MPQVGAWSRRFLATLGMQVDNSYRPSRKVSQLFVVMTTKLRYETIWGGGRCHNGGFWRTGKKILLLVTRLAVRGEKAG